MTTPIRSHTQPPNTLRVFTLVIHRSHRRRSGTSPVDDARCDSVISPLHPFRNGLQVKYSGIGTARISSFIQALYRNKHEPRKFLLSPTTSLNSSHESSTHLTPQSSSHPFVLRLHNRPQPWEAKAPNKQQN